MPNKVVFLFVKARTLLVPVNVIRLTINSNATVNKQIPSWALKEEQQESLR